MNNLDGEYKFSLNTDLFKIQIQIQMFSDHEFIQNTNTNPNIFCPLTKRISTCVHISLTHLWKGSSLWSNVSKATTFKNCLLPGGYLTECELFRERQDIFICNVWCTILNSLVEYTEPGGLKERFVCNVKWSLGKFL